uniref:RRM domain-containing protein n=1 Tax=Pseudo-nitzschia australis TaxID=44445 RepID=A0A6U9Z0P3_9STRA|mmetsp:Transcript_24129/g.52855  ORF Transcript_24129/g.52855 Transcript_24129/m.52855 type:complete len:476 (+) Transcript_24129:22-1449(+)|eukprot:CAMPEP_0168224582 /NCGR_PEP_ID=MMETSP0140_2-20121125/12159_1 /TAXON_ID=44445 /ORGANISM="Pseudo-nitzschia australis, Strain 10249 10 AB" /LENGTH=475 /DNA_ID=CAMNT_0008155017 /DNA_START=22 /DNA_END=1449 /DNA_ORIENTATION=+
MGKKSAAQLRRLEKRATARGEKYVLPVEIPLTNDGDEDMNKSSSPESNTTDNEKTNDNLRAIALRLKKELQEIEANSDLVSKDRRSAKRKAEAIASEDSGMSSSELIQWLEKNDSNSSDKSTADAKTDRRLAVAQKLLKELKKIDKDEELKSKDRRSAKRKAEAICSEEIGMSIEELLEWYEKNKKCHEDKEGKTMGPGSHRDPLIAFVGQLSYETTSDDLLEHICSNLGDDYPASKIKKMTKIRLLTDTKTKRSRGMAFVEVDDPEFLYALLKLHQTYLKGRRINVERSAGGKKYSEARKSKLENYRKEQGAFFAEIVENILAEYKKTGELREDELDEGVITVCKRHSGPVVQAAVAEYMEKGGRDMNNPSAYLTFLVTKFAKEGIHDVEDTGKTKHSKPDRKRKEYSTGDKDGKRTKEWKGTSEFAKSGVDMSMSEQGNGSKKSINGGTRDLSKIFPSSQRGRGRGYMSNVRR